MSSDPEREYFRRRDHRSAGYHSRLVSQAIPATLTLPDKPSIAVLPFQNMSGDPEQDYFSDGMVEDIITALSRIPSLFVIARSSRFAYKDKAVDVRQEWGVTSGAPCARRQRAQGGWKHVEDPLQGPAIITPPHTTRLVGQQWPGQAPFSVA
jgi:hypothetical protein